MPGHFVGGYLAWPEMVPGSILIDKQFRGLCTAAWAHSQVLLSLLEKIVSTLRKLQGSAFWGPGRACQPKADSVSKTDTKGFSGRSSGTLIYLAYCFLFYLGFFHYQQNQVIYYDYHVFLVFGADEKDKRFISSKGEYEDSEEMHLLPCTGHLLLPKYHIKWSPVSSQAFGKADRNS